MNEEILKKAKAAKSVEELLALAKENGIELTEEQAKAYFAQLHPTTGELADDELDAVAGGGCGDDGGKKCPRCGEKMYVIPNTNQYSCPKCSGLRVV